MKHLLFISGLLLMLVSCKKERSQDNRNNFSINKIQLQLKDNLSANDFQQLDFNNTVLSNMPTFGKTFLRIPFLNKELASDFVLLDLQNGSNIISGKIFNINKNIQSLSTKPVTQFNGNIKIYSLGRNLLTSSLITNGFIEEFHPKIFSLSQRVEVVEVPLMPEVIIVCSPSSGGGVYNYGNYIDLMSLNNVGQGGAGGGAGIGGLGSGGGGYYNNSNPFPHTNYNAPPVSGGASNPSNDNSVLVDFESGNDLPAININQYMKCFNSIPDVGATCSIKIMTDIPVDSDPNKFFDWSTGSPGHTFLQITKSNGGQSVQQNIGFYPVKGWKTILSPAPEESKFVDNATHEFNASLLMNLDPDKFKSTLIHIQYLSNFIKYDMANYNCTDFALEVFNYRRGGGNQLAIPMYDIPGGDAPNGTATPQGLYKKLKEMKSNNTADAPNITIPVNKAFAGASKGPCN